MRSLVVLASLLSFETALAAGLSHKRQSGETSVEAFARYDAERLAEGIPAKSPGEASDTPYDNQERFADLDASTVPEWDSIEALSEVFEDIRDLRHLQTPARPSFQRRISWLYPDDGCFARAALARQKIEDQWGKPLAKLFIFGDLEVQTPNSPDGSVQWAWHVVPLVKINGVLHVIDPAIDPKQPMTAEAWALKQVSDINDARFAICKSYSYSPYSRCTDATANDESRALSDQQTYLGYEWSRVQELSRDPERELGDFPPWLN